MARNIIDLPTLGDDGKLYRDTAVDMVESLIPNLWKSEQWEQPVIVSDDPTRSEQNPSLFQNPNGDIWLMYTAQATKKPDDNSDGSMQGTAEIRRKISRDGGRTWGPTEAVFTRPGSFCRQKIQVLSNGRWIFNNFICALDGFPMIRARHGAGWRFPEAVAVFTAMLLNWNPANWSACCAAVRPTISTARNPTITERHGVCP